MRRSGIAAVVLGLALAACGGGDDDGGGAADAAGEVPVPTGGWSTSDDSLYACFDNTNRADFSASRADVAQNPCCVWTERSEGTGQIVFPTSNTATWEMLNLDTLEITPDPPCEGAGCDAVVYRRNPTVTCFP